ncbi:hypothetical protein DPEC_G00340950 [Dallia pectoralis]|uniref:Uncharacterized protein n=1 Tax=Dallia pectoralis TaxID=75939 RepID=A0ACC2F583_DALPE|nr:hypothetical protein DPEC_G00340950 [Dallia pectoralis]
MAIQALDSQPLSVSSVALLTRPLPLAINGWNPGDSLASMPQPDYCMGTAEESGMVVEMLKDQSADDMWSHLWGEPITLKYLDLDVVFSSPNPNPKARCRPPHQSWDCAGDLLPEDTPTP